MKIDATKAWQETVKNRNHRWYSDIERFRLPYIRLEHKPKFTLDINNSFFCIGSCFARNIEEHLLYRDIKVLSKRVIAPKNESPMRPNGFLNKFTTPSMVNEIEATLGIIDLDQGLICGENGWVDPQLAPGIAAVSEERARSRRGYISQDYFARISDASVIILTLGLIETWFDSIGGIYWNTAPSLWDTRRYPGRFFFERRGFVETLNDLERLKSLIKELSPDAKIIVTVSPVPLTTTFSGEDIVVANSYSKSVLRAASQIFSEKYADVDYFPSYEFVTWSPRDASFSSVDFAHVNDRLVGLIMEEFIKSYLGISCSDATQFNELLYLHANPDVEDEVRSGALESGFSHWKEIGFKIGRPLRPPILPDWAVMAGIT